MEINGVAHVMLTVSNFEACYPFYEKLLTYLGMKPVMRSEELLYCVGGRTAVGIMRGDDSYRAEKFQQRRVGLHHVCARASAATSTRFTASSKQLARRLFMHRKTVRGRRATIQCCSKIPTASGSR